MKLKDYQDECLKRLAAFLRLCRTMKPEEAYEKATDDAESRSRLGTARGYTPLEAPVARASIPVVSIKVPTGGGKTILGAHAIRLAADWAETDAPLALWFAPTDTIRSQTAEALKKAGHPYREALEEAFGAGRVRVFDLSETDQIRPADLAGGACVIVATMQSFVKRDTDKYRVYKDREALEPLFASWTPRNEAQLELREDDPSKPKCSLANLCAMRQPVAIADEAHHMTSELSRRTLARLAPCVVIGLSATPERENNTLWAARATELFAEEMIKLPVELTEYPAGQCDWTMPVLAALAKRDELEELAMDEWNGGRGAPWLRPIALFQAQSDVKGAAGRVTAAELRRFLVDEAGRDPAEIAVVTGEQKELDGVDVRDPRCPVRLVVTVEALKEGWDCPSAAVLCSVANVKSETATVQLLGRVMRQPGAKRRRTPALNKAFAFAASDGFGAAASALAEGLRARGFDEAEAEQAINWTQPEMPVSGDGPLFGCGEEEVRIGPALFDEIGALLPQGAKVYQTADGGALLHVDAALPEATLEAVTTSLERGGGEAGKRAAAEFRSKAKAAARRMEATAEAPFRKRRVVMPGLVSRLESEDIFVANAEEAYAEFGDGIARFLPAVLLPGEFRMVRMGDTFQLFLDGEAVRAEALPVRAASSHAIQAEFSAEGFVSRLDAASLVNSLDGLTPCAAISRAGKREWIARIIAALVADGATPEALFVNRHALAETLRLRLDKALDAARAEAFQRVFRFDIGGEAPGRTCNGHVCADAARPKATLALRWDEAFVLDESLYEAYGSSIRRYDGDYVFKKHFLGRFSVPAFDGSLPHGEGEEFECAKLIDAHPRVVDWLRNVARHPYSFKLPVASGWFYPDFVGELDDGRLFAVEYKGAQLVHNPDTLEKSAIGRLWAEASCGKCLYATVTERDEAGRDTRTQIDDLFSS